MCDTFSTRFAKYINQPSQHLTFLYPFSFRLSCKLLRPQNGGIPCLASLPVSNCIQVAQALSHNALMAHILMTHSLLSLFYCAHWQTYVSGTLQFGYIDVTEGQIVVMGVMLISSLEDFLDIDIWMSSVSTLTTALTRKINCSLPALLLQSQPAGDPVWCCLWHLLHVQGRLSDIQYLNFGAIPIFSDGWNN